jgi:hypothetical protein
VFRRFTLFAITCALLACIGLLSQRAAALRQDKNVVTAEAVAETVIFTNGSRPVLDQVRRNGVERGRMTRVVADGRTEESTYERRFIRGENSIKDKVRVDLKSPTIEYALVYGDGRTWGLINGAPFTPREEATTNFLAQKWHDTEALLRYKEDGSTVTYVGKEKQMGLDLYVLDLTDKEQRRTRYYISAKTGRILWLEYEKAPAGGGKPVKYMKKFYDYHAAQGTLVPYRTVLYEDGKQIQETRVLTVTYGIKMEESLFQNPEAQTTASQP